MHVKQPLGDLVSHVLDVVRVHAVGIVPDHVHQVLSAVLSDEVQVIERLWVGWAHDCLELHYIFVAPKQSQKPNFSQDSVGIDLVIEDVLDLLDGNTFGLGLVVNRVGIGIHLKHLGFVNN